MITPDIRKNQLTIEQLTILVNAFCPKQQPVVLLSCDGGAGGNNSLAQQLANSTGRSVNGNRLNTVYTPRHWIFGIIPFINNRTFQPKEKSKPTDCDCQQ